MLCHVVLPENIYSIQFSSSKTQILESKNNVIGTVNVTMRHVFNIFCSFHEISPDHTDLKLGWKALPSSVSHQSSAPGWIFQADGVGVSLTSGGQLVPPFLFIKAVITQHTRDRFFPTSTHLCPHCSIHSFPERVCLSL